MHMRGAPSEGTPSAAQTLIVMATWAAACVRARSRRKGRLLELGVGVPWKFPVISECIPPSSSFVLGVRYIDYINTAVFCTCSLIAVGRAAPLSVKWMPLACA